MKLGCVRAWQAEAREDGRLTGADAASFERHAATCQVCARELSELSLLHQATLRLPVLPSTSLQERRQRIELLRRANEIALSPLRRAWAPWVAAASVAFAGVALLVVLLPTGTPVERATAASTSKVPTFRVTASEGAEWRTLERGSTLRLAAKRGRFEIAVDRLQAGQRFLLALPDGELEVQGTRFVVEADADRTFSVRVLEGRVALRLRAQPVLSLGAGDTWTAEPVKIQAQPTVAHAPPSAAPLSSTGAPSILAYPTPSASSVEHMRQPPQAHAANAGVRAGPDFSAAMAAFSAGDYGLSERLFTHFERTHPSDTRVEDTTFLRAVARSRRGDPEAARALAHEYLRRYPNGLRRIDAERLAK